jgi:outer membrane protein OmpA-like peptidoglycan-associated protein
MSDRRAALALCLLWAGCGPSASELAARARQDALQHELAESRQYNDDLKFRLQLAQARSKLLLGLVQGLTIDPDHFTVAPEKLATADASLQSIDRDVEALIATVRTSRENATELRQQREALQRELADARRTIEHAREVQANVDARMQTLQNILAPLSSLVRSGRINVGVTYGRFAIQLPEAALFAQNQTSLSEDGKSLLQRVVTGLHTAPDRQFRVAGPVAPLGKRAAAQRELSLARTVAVLDYLRTNEVNAESAVTTTHQEVAGNNGYIAISLVPMAEELPTLPSPEQLLTPE